MKKRKVKIRLDKKQLDQLTSDRLRRKVLEQLVNQVGRVRTATYPV